MSTTDLSQYNANSVPSGAGKRFGIVVSEWNSEVTFAMLEGAKETLLKHGVAEEDIEVFQVPGSFELIYGCSKLVTEEEYDAVIALGSIVKGETPHFDYISESVMMHLGQMNICLGDYTTTPIINGVLTTLDLQQALDRAGGKLGNKGVECAVVALRMAAFGKEG